MNGCLRWSSLFLVGFSCALLSGCSGCTGPSSTGKSTDKKGKDTDPLVAARDLYRKATEAARFRDANEQVNKVLDVQADPLAKFQPGSKDPAKLKELLTARGVDIAKLDARGVYLKFLEAVVGLDKGEIDEVDSGTLRLLDAHYLEGCFLLREISRSMPLEGLSPLERAEFCFRWVVRQVVLQEARDEMLPPQYVLKRGSGSSRERAFVFFALLQQLDLDVCVIAVPGKDSNRRPWLVGVLIPTGDKTDVYLFDARLGLPVPGTAGKGIATLAQLKAEPQLLDHFKLADQSLPYDVDAGQLARSEILLFAPLSALSARMRYLQEDVLADADRVNLAVQLPELVEKCEQLKLGPVRVWNKSAAVLQAPTNALRLFLPVDEGGIDKKEALGAAKPNRLQAFQNERTPHAVFLHGFLEERAWLPEVPAAAMQLQSIAFQLWAKYALDPAQQLLRGRLDDTGRLLRAQALATELDAFDLVQGGPATEVDEWKKRVANKAKQGRIQDAFNEDQWLLETINNPDDKSVSQNLRPKILSYIVLRAVKSPLQFESDDLLALRWHEKAERLQVHYELLAAGNAADLEKRGVRDKVRVAWEAAVTRGEAPTLPGTLALEAWQTAVQAGGDLVKTGYAQLATDLVEYHLQCIRRATAARLLLVRALEKTPNKLGRAKEVLEKVQADLVDLEKQITRNSLAAVLSQPAPVTQRDEIGNAIARMVADCGPGGSLFWMRYAAALRLGQLKVTKG
jgi:hypothetical protein